MKYLLLLLLLPITTLADSKNTYNVSCSGCHGSKGEGRAGFSPKLAGQHWQYLRDQIKDIKSGKRTNGNSSMMKGIFKAYDNKEIEDLSKYLEKIK